MEQSERRRILIDELLAERQGRADVEIPDDDEGQKQLLRGLFNIRMPGAAPAGFIRTQDEYLAEETRNKGIVSLLDIAPVLEDIYVWQGDITTLKVDAIVNAANSGMTGCWVPNHRCIDNAIHTFAGVQLRNACQEYMDKMRAEQGGNYAEPTGSAMITPGFNLPAAHVIHTVGPIITGALTEADEEALASCYKSCLQTASDNGLESIAFCCISTGEFHFPNERAAEIAVATVQQFQKDKNLKVVFNVFKDLDREIYERLLLG